MEPKTKISITAIVSLVYIAINTLLIANEFYWFALIPILVLFAFAFVHSLNNIFILVAFITPFSINIAEFGSSFGLSIPAEPMLALLLLFFIFKVFHDKIMDRAILKHPISIALIFYFSWMLISTIISQDLMVSAKWFLAKMWLIIPVYFFGILVFKDLKNIPRFVWAYVLGLIPVIFFTISVHAKFGFSDHAAHWAMSPFYNDHTSYGAILAMFIPIIFGFAISKDEYSRNVRLFTFITLAILLIAIYFSISRAAWASIVLSIGVFVMIKFRIRFWWVFIAGMVVVFLFFSFQSEIIMKLEKNKQDSSKDFVEHVQSMSNIATDASNLERINRWNSAINLFKARPIFGWGPGTYQFVYAPYQNVEDKTLISTNVGNKGTAHSEYLLILSEEGILGIISLLAIFLGILFTALKVVAKGENPVARRYALLLFLGLITYITHAFFNNFLDTDKAAVPFWGFVAGIVAIDLYHSRASIDTEE